MLRKILRNTLLALALTAGFSATVLAAPLPEGYSKPFVTGISTNDILYNEHAPITQELITMVEHNAELKALLVKSIAKAKEINPDRNTNPAQTLEEYYAFMDWAATALPWKILPAADTHSTLYDSINQSIGYFYFINDIPLEELQGKGLYHNSLQYVEPYRSWMINFIAQYGLFLNTEKSWSPEYYARAKANPDFHLQDNTFESPSNWHSFNDFFARHLSSPAVRPITEPNNPSIVTAPADSQPQGLWKIKNNGLLEKKQGVLIKSRRFRAVENLLAGSAYKHAFDGGTLTHTFLDINDYYRYHFPVSGIIKEVALIHMDDAPGGIIEWDKEAKEYVEKGSPELNWQMIETRGLVVVDTEKYGLVAILPVGMCQISSVNFEDTVKVGAKVKKGDMLGCFLYGGSDIVMIFQKGIKVDLAVKPDQNGTFPHLNMGNAYAKLSK